MLSAYLDPVRYGNAWSQADALVTLRDVRPDRSAIAAEQNLDAFAQAIATVPDKEVDTDRVTCLVTNAVTATTRAGAIPVRGVVIEADGKMIGRTGQRGKLREVASAGEGRIALKALYENQDARLKREAFTIEITRIARRDHRSDRGRHVYYNGGTEGSRRGQFRLKGQAWTSLVEPATALTKAAPQR